MCGCDDTVQQVAKWCCIHLKAQLRLENLFRRWFITWLGSWYNSCFLSLWGCPWSCLSILITWHLASTRVRNSRIQIWSCSAFLTYSWSPTSLILLCSTDHTGQPRVNERGNYTRAWIPEGDDPWGHHGSWLPHHMKKLHGYSACLTPRQQEKEKTGREPTSMEGRTYCV